MRLGLVGLGRMGGGIRDRLVDRGHEVVAYDQDPSLGGVESLEAMVDALEAPRVVWVMVPSGAATEDTLVDLWSLLDPGDIIVDGGNSNYRDSVRRGEDLAALGIRFLDAGTSGGIWGRTEGFCVMVGGPADAFAIVEPIFAALTSEGGYAHVGASGAGHFVKMTHNGIEYGLMQAYAEGFALLRAYDPTIDLQAVSALWNRGSVVRSWLLELAERAFTVDPDLDTLRGVVDDSGEGRWMVQEAIERGVPLDVIALAVFNRFSSRDDNAFAMRVLAALRREFGGHAVHAQA
jgi:6-phosphogluconate dehydrogenase